MKEQENLARLRRDLRDGRADDLAFDRLYHPSIRAKSARFWTPVAVASRAAQLFASQNVATVLDIGSGVGKFCLVAACLCPNIEFTGIEQRPHLVDAARVAGDSLGADNARFFVGDATRISWSGIDGLYLYNPFAENIFEDDDPLDRTVELSESRMVADVRRVLAALVGAPVGTCMVTYNSFGGPIPATYDLVHSERAGVDLLHLWVKRREVAENGAYYYEDLGGVTLVGASSGAPQAAPSDGGAAPPSEERL